MGDKNPMYGKPKSQETLTKMSNSHRGKQMGSENPNYNGGVTSERHLIRMNAKMNDWRMAVFRRDHFRDKFTGEKGKIIAHHIIPFKMIIDKYNITSVDDALKCEELWDINNGVTLLEKNHKAHHSKYKNKACSPLTKW
jgi:hypothetical protein